MLLRPFKTRPELEAKVAEINAARAALQAEDNRLEEELMAVSQELFEFYTDTELHIAMAGLEKELEGLNVQHADLSAVHAAAEEEVINVLTAMVNDQFAKAAADALDKLIERRRTGGLLS